MKTKVKPNNDFSVMNVDNKFVVTKNGKPVFLPSNGGQKKITEFENKEDANKYMNILASLNQNAK
jgi:hypothetical protein